MAGDSVRINGVQISWPSAKIKIDGAPYRGITSVDYADGVEKTYAYGMGRHHAPRGRTLGKYTPELLVITCWTSTAETIRKGLAQKAGGRGISSVSVPIVLQFIEKDDAIITIEALDSTLVKNEASNEEGPDALAEKLSFMPMRLLRNGVALYDTTEPGS